MDYILTTSNLAKRYRSKHALRSLDIHVPKGSIYGLIGRNGAGKTTLIRLICGLQRPTDGGFTLFGQPHNSKGILQARRRMGAIVERPAFYGYLSAADNLRHQYKVLGIRDESTIPDLLRAVGLENTGRTKAASFSLGMCQRLGIALALCGDPDFLVLDEPTNGLDPEGIIQIRELLLRLNREKGVTILISSHLLDELSRLATHYGFIDNGMVLRDLSAAEVAASYRRCTRIRVTNPAALACVLDEMGLEYKILPDNEADIFADLNVSDLVLRLQAGNCQILNLQAKDESLESFYLNLLGGGQG